MLFSSSGTVMEKSPECQDLVVYGGKVYNSSAAVQRNFPETRQFCQQSGGDVPVLQTAFEFNLIIYSRGKLILMMTKYQFHDGLTYYGDEQFYQHKKKIDKKKEITWLNSPELDLPQKLWLTV